MKKIFILSICFLFALNLIKAQCNVENVFPLELNVSKFNAITALNLNKNITPDEDWNSQVYDIWWTDKSLEYLKNDSVLKSSLRYKYLYHPCLSGDEKNFLLYFVDGNLYKIVITIEFSNTQFEQCLSNYNKLLEAFKISFPYVNKMTVNLSETNEQVGEGYSMFKSKEEDGKQKFEEIKIEYDIEYETKSLGSDVLKTGNVKKYIIEMSHVDLKKTKLTKQGF